jgi:hypothetical protein
MSNRIADHNSDSAGDDDFECWDNSREYAARPLPPLPTAALPGSAEKVMVMQQRYADGYHLHHPFDARYTGGGSVLDEARWHQMIELMRIMAQLREKQKHRAVL